MSRTTGLLLLVVACLSLAAAIDSPPTTGTLYYSVFHDKHGDYIIKEGLSNKSVAYAVLQLTQNVTGWHNLVVTTTGVADDNIAMYGAGYLEGYMTQLLIWQSYPSFMFAQFNDTIVPDALVEYYNKNVAWMHDMVAKNPEDTYWIHVGLVLRHLKGMLDGYNLIAPFDQKLSEMEIAFLNMDGDLDELTLALNMSGNLTNDRKLSYQELEDRRRQMGAHCSGLVKLTADYSDLFAAHTTWTQYTYMLRIYKKYEFPLKAAGTASNWVTFSSYPALLSSVDDFYETEQRLTVIETTNGLMPSAYGLYNRIKPQTVFSWIRVMVANRMATDGASWANIFSLHNSGTYNNQWFVVDYKLFTPMQPLQPNTLVVLEQIPGYVEWADVTNVLQFGYWPSFNIPYFPYIYNISGFALAAAEYGDWYSYDANPRAEIFRRDQASISNITGMQRMMQYNNWENDPFSLQDPCNQVSCRADLEPKHGTVNQNRAAFGGIDSKVTCLAAVPTGSVYAISGPSHEYLPPFTWSDHLWSLQPYLGQPMVFNFSWTFLDYA